MGGKNGAAVATVKEAEGEIKNPGTPTRRSTRETSF
jgi:hypothetical protein